ncbi:MAG TPA: PDZ domain-containing protein [Thermoanaerobaculia bacterium]|nr:PDZ domain-containing protein [Thermoanaerobaculia bacterium]
MKRLIRAAFAAACWLALYQGPSFAAVTKDVTIPFELVNKNIFIQVQVGRSAPLWFVLDTGNKYAVIDLSVAGSLNLEMADEVPVGGAGKNIITGRLLKNSPFHVVGLDRFSQPLFLALPLADLARASGHEFAGALGYDFISQFVVEVDYIKQRLILHDKESFEYHGAGDILPITFNAAAHPQVHAGVIDSGHAPVDGTFVLDLGSSAAVIFNTPFVEKQQFLAGSRPTVPWLEGRGFGGAIDGSVGRIDALKLGSFRIASPVAIFTRCDSGPFASPEAEGNIGAAILEKFKVILDYARNRIILEPNARFAEPIEYNRSGLSLTTEGDDFKTIKIAAVAGNAPASEAGLQAGDVVSEINGRPATQFTLTQIRSVFKDAKECDLTIRRGDQRLTVKLRLRRII